jgi:hypothetical protein
MVGLHASCDGKGIFYRLTSLADRIVAKAPTNMSKNQRPTPRKPATKFMHLRKKMEKQKVKAKRPSGKKK